MNNLIHHEILLPNQSTVLRVDARYTALPQIILGFQDLHLRNQALPSDEFEGEY